MQRSLHIVLAFVILLILTSVRTSSFAANPNTTIIVFGSENSLYTYDDTQKDITLFYRNQELSFQNVFLKEPSISPNRQYVAAITYSQAKKKQQLLILDLRSNVITTLDDVYAFSWSPDGFKIAYVSGTDYEGGVGFKPSGLWTLDLKSKNTKKLMSDGGYDINWAQFDNQIYVADFRGVYKYDYESGRRKETTHLGIYFSPDGRYYFKKGFEGDESALYITRTNENITSTFELSDKILWTNDVKWSPNGKFLLLLGGDLGCRIWDIGSRRIILEIPRVDDAWWSNDGLRVFIKKLNEMKVESHDITRSPSQKNH